jgi:hypothetical protein
LAHFLDDWQEIGQRTNSAQWRGICRMHQRRVAASTNAFSITLTETPR